MVNKFKYTLGLVALVTGFFITFSFNNARAATINYQYQLGTNEGSPYRANNKIVVAHETGVTATAENNAIFEKRTWYTNGAYVTYIVGNSNQGVPGQIYQIGQPGYQSWGAGTWGNANAPVQIELARTYNPNDFKINYVTYINLLRESAQKYGIPLTTDGTDYIGVKSHNWISNNVWGDHSDPYGYLSQMGISAAQFQRDVAYGVGTVQTPKPTPTPQQKPSVPTNTNTGKMVSESATFKNGDTPIQVRYGSSLKATKSGMLPPYASIKYYGYVVNDGYVWVVYTGFNGKTLYCPVRSIGKIAWGTFS